MRIILNPILSEMEKKRENRNELDKGSGNAYLDLDLKKCVINRVYNRKTAKKTE